MRLIYTVLLYLLTPFVLLRLLWRGLKLRDYWRRWGERFGFVPAPPGGIAVWVHAVSVGETVAALPLIQHLVAIHPPRSILVTTTTPTGSARVRSLLGDRVLHTYAPYDLPEVVARFLVRTRPRLAIVMETELWPNLFRALKRRDVPLIIANARLSPRSFAGYRRIRDFASATLADASAIAAQSQADAERFRALGAPAERVSVMGNIKFDLAVPDEMVARGRALRTALGAARPMWIAASTHEGEEEMVLAAHRRILAALPDAALILVPRHPQRFDAVARLLEKSDLAYIRRSTFDPSSVSRASSPVLLGDSMGEMYLYFAAADLAFVGGSLVPVGGHNVLEPAALELPVLFGPHMHNFMEAREVLLSCGAASEVAGAEALATAVSGMLRDPACRQAMGAAGKTAVEANRGALQRLLATVGAVQGQH